MFWPRNPRNPQKNSTYLSHLTTYLCNLRTHITYVTTHPMWSSRLAPRIIWTITIYENLCYSPTHSLSYSRKEKKHVVIPRCCVWHENNFPRKKLPLLREAMCDNYFIVTWSVLNHMDVMGQTRELNSLVKFEALGTSLRTVSLFYDFKRYIKSSCKIYF